MKILILYTKNDEYMDLNVQIGEKCKMEQNDVNPGASAEKVLHSTPLSGQYSMQNRRNLKPFSFVRAKI